MSARKRKPRTAKAPTLVASKRHPRKERAKRKAPRRAGKTYEPTIRETLDRLDRALFETISGIASVDQINANHNAGQAVRAASNLRALLQIDGVL